MCSSDLAETSTPSTRRPGAARARAKPPTPQNSNTERIEMNSIIALVYLSVAVILIVFGVKQIKNRKNLRKINQKQEDEVKEKIKLGILSADTVYRERTETGRVFYEVPEDLKKAVVLNLICFAIMLILIFLGIKIGILLLIVCAVASGTA